MPGVTPWSRTRARWMRTRSQALREDFISISEGCEEATNPHRIAKRHRNFSREVATGSTRSRPRIIPNAQEPTF